MGFIYRKRINLGKGFGLNLSKSGISSSFRTTGGTDGSKGYSVRTGIPGLYHRGTYKKGGCASVILLLVIIASTVAICLLNSCSGGGKQSKDSNVQEQGQIRVIYEKKFGMTQIYMCLVHDTNWKIIQAESNELLKKSEIGFVYCYDDSSKIKNIISYNNPFDAFPDEGVGYVCEIIKRPGDPIEFNKFADNYRRKEAPGNISRIKFVLIEKKERNGRTQKNATFRWYVFFVENFYDNKEVYELMKKEAMKLPVDDPNSNIPNSQKQGFTNIFFFIDKEKLPKLAKDGGWGAKESANSMDKKFGKYLVGHITLGAGEDLYFSKGF